MDTQLAELKKLTILQILQAVATGKSVRAACEEFNTSANTFYRYTAEHPEVVQDFLASQKEILQTQVTQLVVARTKLLQEVLYAVSDGSAELTLDEKLAVLDKLTRLQNEYQKQLGLAEATQVDPASTFLTGPTLRRIVRVTETAEFEQEPPPVTGEVIELPKTSE